MDLDTFQASRRALHGVAELVLAGPAYARDGDIRLRPTPGGFGVWAQPGPRIDGVELVAGTRLVPLGGTIQALADAAGVAPRVAHRRLPGRRRDGPCRRRPGRSARGRTPGSGLRRRRPGTGGVRPGRGKGALAGAFRHRHRRRHPSESTMVCRPATPTSRGPMPTSVRGNPARASSSMHRSAPPGGCRNWAMPQRSPRSLPRAGLRSCADRTSRPH